MKKILLVDGDKTLQAELTHYLTKHGYSLHAVTSGVQEVKILAQELPDLVIVDVTPNILDVMPSMDSLEFYFRLQATRPGHFIPTIFLKAKHYFEDPLKDYYYFGACEYITKPFDPEKLLAKIEAQIERSLRDRKNPPTSLDLLDLPQDVESIVDLLFIPAEAQVFWGIIQGLTDKQISQRMSISRSIVQAHLRNILTKLNLESRSRIIRFAFDRGYRPPSI